VTPHDPAAPTGDETMNMIIPILFILMIPIMAIIDYFWLRERYKKYHGTEPEPYYWFAPCFVEVGCFVAGYLVAGAFP